MAAIVTWLQWSKQSADQGIIDGKHSLKYSLKHSLKHSLKYNQAQSCTAMHSLTQPNTAFLTQNESSPFLHYQSHSFAYESPQSDSSYESSPFLHYQSIHFAYQSPFLLINPVDSISNHQASCRV